MKQPEYKEKYPHLFSPLEIPIKNSGHSVTFKNRLMTSAMAILGQNVDGTLGKRGFEFYSRPAYGGFAGVAIQTEVFDENNIMHDRTLRVSEKDMTFMDLHPLLKVHRACDCRSELQLVVNGGSTISRNGEKTFTASPLKVREGVYTKEATEEDMEKVIDMTVQAAIAARRARFDVIQFTGCAGLGLHNFLSPNLNHRTDKYGGSVENMCRFPIMLIDRVREVIGDEIAIHLRMPVRDHAWYDYGINPEICAEEIRLLQEHVDYISIFAGDRMRADGRPTFYPTYFMDAAEYAPELREVRRILGDDLHVPLGLVGKIHEPALAEQLIAEGTADFILVGRQSVADPDFVNKIKSDHEEDIRPCLHCNFCVDGNRRDSTSLGEVRTSSYDTQCRVNPFYGNGYVRRTFEQPKDSKKVAVIGGGIAGMQAAVEAADNGHAVTIFEKTDNLGGQLNQFADTMWFTVDLVKLCEYFKTQVAKRNIEVRLNTEATPEQINAEGFDTVIAAVGSEPVTPRIPGVESENVSQVIECFGHEERYGKRVVLIGGGLSACDAALYLSENGHEVTIVEQAHIVAPKAALSEYQNVIYELDKHGVTRLTSHTCLSIDADGVTAKDAEGKEVVIPADSVILAVGNKPKKALAESFRYVAQDYRKIGDCDTADDLLNAIHQGYDAGATVGVV